MHTIISRSRLAFAGAALLSFYSCTAAADTASPPSLFKKVYSFSAASGIRPAAGIIKGADGAFYGTTREGGTSGLGTIYKLGRDGSVSILHSFANCSTEGCNPESTVVEGKDGALYGSTMGGGTYGAGVIYRVTKAGGYSVLYTFSDCTKTGCKPRGSLTAAKDGLLYGTTDNGGATGNGTFFSISPAGQYSLIYSFPNCDAVCHPYDAMVQGTDGAFYGVGNYSNTLFRVTAAGETTRLASFSDCGKTGCRPQGSVTLGADGTLYGVAAEGGQYGQGTIWQYTSQGGVEVLASFTGSNGSRPSGAPLLIKNVLYGSTTNGGENGKGAVYKLPLGGTVSVLYSFRSDGIFTTPHDPRHPVSSPLSLIGKLLLGVTSYGGDSDQGGVYLVAPLK